MNLTVDIKIRNILLYYILIIS